MLLPNLGLNVFVTASMIRTGLPQIATMTAVVTVSKCAEEIMQIQYMSQVPASLYDYFLTMTISYFILLYASHAEVNCVFTPAY